VADRVRARVLVSGRVQGVFFRQETARNARERGVSGYVRNLPDGRVEAVFEGDADAVDELIGWCRRGPRGAHVEAVDAERECPTGDGGAFEVRW
jgi:acylphosphatase